MWVGRISAGALLATSYTLDAAGNPVNRAWTSRDGTNWTLMESADTAAILSFAWLQTGDHTIAIGNEGALMTFDTELRPRAVSQTGVDLRSWVYTGTPALGPVGLIAMSYAGELLIGIPAAG
jgi:hypothetical protein